MEGLAYLQLELSSHELEFSEADIPWQKQKPLAILRLSFLPAWVLLAILLSGQPSLAQQPNLRIGSQGEEVRRIEEQLARLNFFFGAPDNFFGMDTENAVINFQRRYNLQVDGIVGPETRGKLNSLLPEAPPPPVTLNPPVSIPEAPRRDTPVAQLSRTQVLEIQNNLQALGLYQGELDGIYGPQTREAVRQFQRRNGLRVTGVANTETITALRQRVSRNAPYVVVIPGNFSTLTAVQNYFPGASLAQSRRGAYVNAGAYSSRDLAESYSQFLRAQGFDARVTYLP